MGHTQKGANYTYFNHLFRYHTRITPLCAPEVGALKKSPLRKYHTTIVNCRE